MENAPKKFRNDRNEKINRYSNLEINKSPSSIQIEHQAIMKNGSHNLQAKQDSQFKEKINKQTHLYTVISDHSYAIQDLPPKLELETSVPEQPQYVTPTVIPLKSNASNSLAAHIKEKKRLQTLTSSITSFSTNIMTLPTIVLPPLAPQQLQFYAPCELNSSVMRPLGKPIKPRNPVLERVIYASQQKPYCRKQIGDKLSSSMLNNCLRMPQSNYISSKEKSSVSLVPTKSEAYQRAFTQKDTTTKSAVNYGKTIRIVQNHSQLPKLIYVRKSKPVSNVQQTVVKNIFKQDTQASTNNIISDTTDRDDSGCDTCLPPS